MIDFYVGVILEKLSATFFELLGKEFFYSFWGGNMRIILPLIASVLLAGCLSGGGGGGSSSASYDAKTTTHGVFLPEGVSSEALSGVDGFMTYAGAPKTALSIRNAALAVPKAAVSLSARDASGFIIQRSAPNNALSASAVRTEVLTSWASLFSSSAAISQQVLSGGSSATGAFTVQRAVATKPTELAVAILKAIGLDSGKVLKATPATLATEPSATKFMVYMAVTYFTPTDVVISVMVVPWDLSGTYQAVAQATAGGSNVTKTTSDTVKSKSDSFVGTSGSNKADFLFVVDNSGSMSDDQVALAQAGTAFGAALNSSGLDWTIKTITTDGLVRDTSFNGAVTNSIAEFKLDVQAGSGGSSTESV